MTPFPLLREYVQRMTDAPRRPAIERDALLAVLSVSDRAISLLRRYLSAAVEDKPAADLLDTNFETAQLIAEVEGRGGAR